MIRRLSRPFSILVAVLLPLVLAPAAAEAQWSDNFDAYATDLSLHGVGGWKGWFNSAAATAYTRDEQARSAPNSVEIVGTTDLVHEYSGYTTGTWRYTAWQFLPSAFIGQAYFILMNTYDDGGSNLNWSVQVRFDGAAGTVANDGGMSGGSLTLVTGQWVELRVDINLTADTCSFYYNGALLYSGTWTGEVSGGGSLNIAAVDLFANGATSVYYDDMSLAQPGGPQATTTSLASSPNPSVYGENVTFTATVSPATASGSVSFRDGPTLIATGTLASGTATFSTATLGLGSHAMGATYGGDATHGASISQTLTQVVEQAPTDTALEAIVGAETVELRATVTPAAATGTVEFRIGTDVVATVALVGGQASATVPRQGGTAVAAYSGDANYLPSTSAGVAIAGVPIPALGLTGLALLTAMLALAGVALLRRG